MSDKAFLKLPRVLITKPLRSKLSDSAIVLYSYLISLYELSVRNGERFRDENGRYYRKRRTAEGLAENTRSQGHLCYDERVL